MISVLEGGYSLASPIPSPAVTNTATTRRGPTHHVMVPNKAHVNDKKKMMLQSVYGEEPGDGGLVKGILAHTAALCDLCSFASDNH